MVGPVLHAQLVVVLSVLCDCEQLVPVLCEQWVVMSVLCEQ